MRQRRLPPPDSTRMPATPCRRYPPQHGIPFSEEKTHSPLRFGGGRGIFVTRCGLFVAYSIDWHARPKQADVGRYVLVQRDPRRRTTDREGKRCKHRKPLCVEPIWLDGSQSATSSTRRSPAVAAAPTIQRSS